VRNAEPLFILTSIINIIIAMESQFYGKSVTMTLKLFAARVTKQNIKRGRVIAYERKVNSMTVKFPLTLAKRYYFPRMGVQVTFIGYDRSGLAMVEDDDNEIYYCHETHLENVTEQINMTIDEALKREG
jgi:hypothetical protein